MRGVEPAEVTLQLIEEEKDGVMAVVHNRVESDIRFFLGHPLGMIGSDGNAISPDGHYKDFKPHPRFYGPYPRILGRYVREEPAVLTLEQAVYKMSGFPAQRMGFKERGFVKEGLVADLAVFDPEKFADRGTTFEPNRTAAGMVHVVVNGAVALEDGELTGARGGQVLRRA